MHRIIKPAPRKVILFYFFRILHFTILQVTTPRIKQKINSKRKIRGVLESKKVILTVSGVVTQTTVKILKLFIVVNKTRHN